MNSKIIIVLTVLMTIVLTGCLKSLDDSSKDSDFANNVVIQPSTSID